MSALAAIRALPKRFTKEVLLRPVVVRRRPNADRRLALTFDDGPNPEFTPQVLAVLQRHGAKATFFCVGENLRRHPDVAQAICEHGHEIGNHSMTHAEFGDIGYRELAEELDLPHQIVRRDGKPWITSNGYFRPPKGVINASVLRYCVTRGQRVAYWNRDPKDYAASSARQIVDHFMHDALLAGDIVLLHDKTRHTVEALDELLDNMRQAGLKSVTMDTLLTT